MSSPIQLIRDGIDKADWGLVCEGYSQMTGDDVTIPSPKDKITVMINGLTVYHNGDTNLEKVNNQLEEEFEVLKEEEDLGGGIFNTSKAESKKLSEARKGKVREVREKFVPVQMKCCGCKGTFDVHPDLVPRKLAKDGDEPEFRCDKCMGKSKIK